MNLLQSFMGCMYPDIIRTDSIESMDHDCRFQAANIDEQGNEISRGELQLTNEELIYFKPGKSPFRWPLTSIRRWGCIGEGNKFVFEVGRKCRTGEAIYAFRLNRGSELVAKLNEITRQEQQNQQNTTTGSQSVDTTTGDQSRTSSTPSAHGQKQRRDVGTSPPENQPATPTTDDPRPLSYSLIDFPTTKALNELTQAHATYRDR